MTTCSSSGTVATDAASTLVPASPLLLASLAAHGTAYPALLPAWHMLAGRLARRDEWLTRLSRDAGVPGRDFAFFPPAMVLLYGGPAAYLA